MKNESIIKDCTLRTLKNNKGALQKTQKFFTASQASDQYKTSFHT